MFSNSNKSVRIYDKSLLAKTKVWAFLVNKNEKAYFQLYRRKASKV